MRVITWNCQSSSRRDKRESALQHFDANYLCIQITCMKMRVGGGKRDYLPLHYLTFWLHLQPYWQEHTCRIDCSFWRKTENITQCFGDDGAEDIQGQVAVIMCKGARNYLDCNHDSTLEGYHFPMNDGPEKTQSIMIIMVKWVLNFGNRLPWKTVRIQPMDGGFEHCNFKGTLSPEEKTDTTWTRMVSGTGIPPVSLVLQNQ